MLAALDPVSSRCEKSHCVELIPPETITNRFSERNPVLCVRGEKHTWMEKIIIERNSFSQISWHKRDVVTVNF